MWNFATTLQSKSIVREEFSKPECILPVFCQAKTDNAPPEAAPDAAFCQEPGSAPPPVGTPPNPPASKDFRLLINGKTLKDFMDVPHFSLVFCALC